MKMEQQTGRGHQSSRQGCRIRFTGEIAISTVCWWKPLNLFKWSSSCLCCPAWAHLGDLEVLTFMLHLIPAARRPYLVETKDFHGKMAFELH